MPSKSALYILMTFALFLRSNIIQVTGERKMSISNSPIESRCTYKQSCWDFQGIEYQRECILYLTLEMDVPVLQENCSLRRFIDFVKAVLLLGIVQPFFGLLNDCAITRAEPMTARNELPEMGSPPAPPRNFDQHSATHGGLQTFSRATWTICQYVFVAEVLFVFKKLTEFDTGIEKHLKELTKMLTVASPWGVTLEVKEDEDQGAFTVTSWLGIIEWSTPCLYCGKEVESFTSILSCSSETREADLPLFALLTLQTWSVTTPCGFPFRCTLAPRLCSPA